MDCEAGEGEMPSVIRQSGILSRVTTPADPCTPTPQTHRQLTNVPEKQTGYE